MLAVHTPEIGIRYADTQRGALTEKILDPVLRSLSGYLLCSGFSIEQLEGNEASTLVQGSAEQIREAMDGSSRSMPTNLRYMQDRTAPLSDQLDRLVSNAAEIRSRMGYGFFRDRDGRSEREVHYSTLLLDGLLWLGIKGGSGAGSFSIDFAIGRVQRNDFRHMRGEMWRTGIDTIVDENGASARVIKQGSAMNRNKKGYEEKRELARKFYELYGISVPRAMTALTICAAHTLEKPTLQLVTQQTFSRPRYTGHSETKVKFDYQEHFRSMGFDGMPNNNKVLVFRGERRGFYKRLIDQDNTGSGLNRRELAGLDEIVHAFNNAQDAVTDALTPLRMFQCHGGLQQKTQEQLNFRRKSPSNLQSFAGILVFWSRPGVCRWKILEF
jgi:hypothetical protein